MASTSPEAVSKKRKDSISHMKRDQPLFASRRLAPLQQAPDFFTESLNTSYVATPSPVRSPPRRQNAHARPRLGPGSGRSLAEAFKATTDNNDEDRRPSSSPSSDRYHAKYDLKQLPSPNVSRPQSSPADPSAGTHDRARTPSPARGRQLTVHLAAIRTAAQACKQCQFRRRH